MKNYFFLAGVRVFRFFTIPLRDVSSAETELNAFLGSHRVLGVERPFADRGANSFWTLCVDYLPGVGGAAAPSFDKKGASTTGKSCRRRTPRLRQIAGSAEQIAHAEAVPVYTIFTNDQLAKMCVAGSVLADLQTLVGVGEARVSKYGPAFLTALQAEQEQRVPSGRSSNGD